MVTGSQSAVSSDISLKHVFLVTLTVQNSALILIMHYSRVMPLVDGQRYHTSTSVFLNEIIKLVVNLAVVLYEMSRDLSPDMTAVSLPRYVMTAIFSNESYKLAIPALIYTIQNTLQYVAVSNLDAATFQVTYQLKILTTAIFSVVMLGRTISSRKWMSLLLLLVGVAIIQLPQSTTQAVRLNVIDDTNTNVIERSLKYLDHIGRSAKAQMTKGPASYQEVQRGPTEAVVMNRQVGLAAVFVACALSGLAGVAFEKILKDSKSAKKSSLWVRNCQLSFWSLITSFFLGVLWKDGSAIAKTGFFAGYNWVVWAAILFQAAGGLVVALVIKYADNIAKNFATSISIILSCVASMYLFDFQITRAFFFGTAIVLFSTYLYTKPESSASSSRVKVNDLRKREQRAQSVSARV